MRMKYLSDDGNPGMHFSPPPSVCVADITVTGCEVRKQVRPSFLQPPDWPSRDSGMSADCLNRRLSAGGEHESPSAGEEKEPDRS